VADNEALMSNLKTVSDNIIMSCHSNAIETIQHQSAILEARWHKVKPYLSSLLQQPHFYSKCRYVAVRLHIQRTADYNACKIGGGFSIPTTDITTFRMTGAISTLPYFSGPKWQQFFFTIILNGGGSRILAEGPLPADDPFFCPHVNF
jgi:hypothetical protein